MKEFEGTFLLVKPIVLKLKRSSYVQLWETDDWLQEGRLILFYLLKDHPELIDDHQKLYCFFKTKFSNYLNDVIRRQESQKRRFNKMAYEEISEISHSLKSQELLLDEFVAYKEAIGIAEKSLAPGSKNKFDKVMRGERFAGKKKFLREIRPYFSDFKD